MDLGSSTWLITNKPWCTGKQLPLGFSVLGHFRMILSYKPQASSDKLDKRQATSYYGKITERKT